MIFRLAVASLRARALTVGLTILSIALSTTLFLGVEKIRLSARDSFAQTISGTDLIMGARSGSVQLMLYSVFHMGNATNNITWESYQDIAARDEVEWTVPISLGDNHRGFRVMGTSSEFFEHYKFRKDHMLSFAKGQAFDDLYDAVVGAEVARALGYDLDDPMIVSHGISSIQNHDDQPFQVSGILNKTGTPIDRTVLVSLEAIEAIHVDWQSGTRGRDLTPVEVIREMELTPHSITAALIGVKSPVQIFELQRTINTYEQEPLLSILPGVALQELWGILGTVETALQAISLLVVLVALLGMMVMILASLNERRREMAIWRSVGASPLTIMGLLLAEALLIAMIGVILGLVILYLALFSLRPVIDQAYGLWLSLSAPNLWEIGWLFAIILFAGFVSLLPAWRAYKISLADGMSVRN